MDDYEALKERKPYKRDIYRDLEKIEQRGKRLKHAKKQKRTAFLRSLGWKNADVGAAETA